MAITAANPFKGRHYPGELILLCVRWYLRFPLAYDPVALVGSFEMRPAALVQLRGIGLDPAPDATGIHLHAAFLHDFRDVYGDFRVGD